MTFTRADIIERVARKCGISKLDAAEFVEKVFETMSESLANGENVKISGFGNFELRDKQARRGRNPQTGKPMEIAARRVMTFKISHLLKEAVNSGQLPSASAKPER